MSNGIGAIHVRGMKGKINVIGMGKTPRGQSFLKKDVKLEVTSMADPKFKDDLAGAIKKILP